MVQKLETSHQVLGSFCGLNIGINIVELWSQTDVINHFTSFNCSTVQQ